jgi:hypothetical protein
MTSQLTWTMLSALRPHHPTQTTHPSVRPSVRPSISQGRPSATDQEVEDAARAACIHDAISTRFPKVRACL